MIASCFLVFLVASFGAIFHFLYISFVFLQIHALFHAVSSHSCLGGHPHNNQWLLGGSPQESTMVDVGHQNTDWEHGMGVTLIFWGRD